MKRSQIEHPCDLLLADDEPALVLHMTTRHVGAWVLLQHSLFDGPVEESRELVDCVKASLRRPLAFNCEAVEPVADQLGVDLRGC